jgi:hypothetical protein
LKQRPTCDLGHSNQFKTKAINLQGMATSQRKELTMSRPLE